MLELRCPACGLANAVTHPAAVEEARCAECEGALDVQRPVRYRVAHGGIAREAQVLGDLARAAVAGTLSPDALLSEEHGPWFPAGERADLFPCARAAVHRAPTAARGARSARPPGPVAAMAALEMLVGSLALLLALVVGAMLSSSGYLAQGLLPLLILGAFGGGHLALARGLQARSIAARNVQLLLAGLGGVGLLLLASAGASAPALLVGGILVAIPFRLLLEADARRWFEDRDDGQGD